MGLLKAGLGILDASQCAQRSLECLTAHRADSGRWNASKILNDPKGAFCHINTDSRGRQQFAMSLRFQTFSRSNGQAAVNANRRLVELQFHGPAKSGMIFIVQGHKTKGLEAARS
jgi:hypothetical protein